MAAGEQLRTVPGEDVARMKLDLALGDADSFGRDTLARIRSHLGSDLVVLGSYLVVKDGGRIRLDMRLQDTAAGETLASASATGTEKEFIDLVTRAGAELRQKLGIEATAVERGLDARASLPATAEAARLYSEGLAKLRVFEALQARDLLEKAVAADPSIAPPVSRARNVCRSKGATASCRATGRRPSPSTERSPGSSPTASSTAFTWRRCSPRVGRPPRR